MSGIRAELVFESPATCPVASASESVDGPITDVSWGPDVDGGITEQFTASDCDGTAVDDQQSNEKPLDSQPCNSEVEEVFDYGSRQVYEFERSEGHPCICEHIEFEVGPVTETYASDGDLHVTLHAGDMDHLRDLIGSLKDRFGQVRIEYLIQGRDEQEESELVPVDLRRLTARQREVLETAHQMGYFEYPRGANASEVATALGIQPSTFTEHLNTAQTKLLDELL